MAEHSAIQWTDATWSAIRARYWEMQDDGSGKERIGWHCEHVSDGCRYCYAERLNVRIGTGRDFKPGELFKPEKAGYRNGGVHVFLDEKMLIAPLRWRKPRMVFVCSMTDLFADFVEDKWITRMFAVMALAPRHGFQILTKRPERMRDFIAHSLAGVTVWKAVHDLIEEWDQGKIRVRLPCIDDDPMLAALQAHGAMWGGETPWPLRNVWLGTSAEDQATADERIPLLLDTPAAVRFLSAEPLLGPISLAPIKTVNMKYGAPDEAASIYALRGIYVPGSRFSESHARLGWVIAGGESGPRARPMHIDWAREIRDQCKAAGVPFFMKQMGKLARMGRADAVQAVGLGGGWQADKPGGLEGVVSFPHRKGGEMIEWPEDLRVREMP